MHSSAWLGRVLMSFHLNVQDKPSLSKGTSLLAGTLETTAYILWLDLFELVNCEPLVASHRGQTKVTV